MISSDAAASGFEPGSKIPASYVICVFADLAIFGSDFDF
jgi:hypothetical protein